MGMNYGFFDTEGFRRRLLGLTDAESCSATKDIATPLPSRTTPGSRYEVRKQSHFHEGALSGGLADFITQEMKPQRKKKTAVPPRPNQSVAKPTSSRFSAE
jgi:hypothetical protein